MMLLLAEILHFKCNFKNIDEKTFINSIFKYIDNIEDLYELNVCQINCKTIKEFLPFLRIRNGRYYFNYDTNKDDDIIFWATFKDQYVIKNK